MQSPEVAKDEERSLFRKWSNWSSVDSCSGNALYLKGQELEFDGQNSHSKKKKKRFRNGCILTIPGLEKQRQADPWSSLATSLAEQRNQIFDQ